MLTQKVPWKNPGIIIKHLLSTLVQWKLQSTFLWKGGEIVCKSIVDTYTQAMKTPFQMCLSHDIMQKAPRGSKMTGLAQRTQLGNRSIGMRRLRMRSSAADDATLMNCLWFLKNNL